MSRMLERLRGSTGSSVQLAQRVSVFLGRGPAYHYVYGRWRLSRWLDRVLVRNYTLDDRAFLDQLRLDDSGLNQNKTVVPTDHQGTKASEAVHHFRRRTAPQFFFQPEDAIHIKSLIDSEQQQTTIRAADEICRNIFSFRRVSPIEFKGGIDWTFCPQGNIDWTWDLNRHAYFVTLGRAYSYTGGEKYAQKFRELFLDWQAKNPVGTNQPGWASVFEVAFRVNTWVWAFHHFRSSPTFDDETCLAFLKGLLEHGSYLDAYLELHVRNNHLLLEAKALLVELSA